METTTEAKAAGQTLATMELLSDQPTIPQPGQSSKDSVKKWSDIAPEERAERKRLWLQRWFLMVGVHPAISQLRDSVYKFCSNYSACPSRGKTLVIFGENGSGKTRVLKLVRTWAKAIGTKLPLVNREDMDGQTGTAWPHFEHWPETLSRFKSVGDLSGVQDLIQCNLAIIDDIGAGHDPSGFANEQLYLVLCRREFRWNLLSTNYPPSEWPAKFDRRVASRLFRNCEHIDLSGVPDYSTL